LKTDFEIQYFHYRMGALPVPLTNYDTA